MEAEVRRLVLAAGIGLPERVSQLVLLASGSGFALCVNGVVFVLAKLESGRVGLLLFVLFWFLQVPLLT